MSSPHYHKLRLWLLLAAFFMTVATLLLPRAQLTREAYDAVAFVDITTSMTVRDLTLGDRPVSRLDLVKDRLRDFVAELPCRSKIGLGIFSERRVFVLFDPIEVCDDFADIEAAIAGLDWRMAWAGDSYVALGIHDAIAVAKRLDADLLFFTDGHEAPPLHWTGIPPFAGKPGEVRGLVVGVGGSTLSPIPKYDNEGREIGVLGPDEVAQENRTGAPPPDAETRPGYHPKWAPFGNAIVNGTEHLSSVKEDHLRAIAAQTGLSYVRLGGASALLGAFKEVARPHEVVVATDIRPYPAAFALFLLVLLFGILPFLESRMRIGFVFKEQSRPQRSLPAPQHSLSAR